MLVLVLVLGILRIEREHESTRPKVRAWIDLQLPENFGAFNPIGALAGSVQDRPAAIQFNLRTNHGEHREGREGLLSKVLCVLCVPALCPLWFAHRRAMIVDISRNLVVHPDASPRAPSRR
ncbi:MAG: hypothetical protein HY791_18865 [Deltaproteobacteria bacterium]|nr:hypothetical protein [Deltaproteobacteria bacterium]